MAEFERILSDWTVTSHMSAIVRDDEQQYITKNYGFSKYCELIRSTEAGFEACLHCKHNAELFRCHGGLYNFAVPINLPSGQTIAYAICGQEKLEEKDEPDFKALAAACQVDEEHLRYEYSQIKPKSREEIEAAKALLSSVINSFVGRSYRQWLSENEETDDRTLAQITQLLYAYNITLDPETGKYSLIIGTGMGRTVAVYKAHTDFADAEKENVSFVHPAYQDKVEKLIGPENLRQLDGRGGHVGTLEFPVLYPDKDSYEWHEINVFAARDHRGKPVINILGRDVTEAHELSEKSNRELQAAAAKNRILSDLTKMLYSYNITLNLNTGKYSMIEGTGMKRVRNIYRTTDDYTTAFSRILRMIRPDYIEQLKDLAGPDTLRNRRNRSGFIGNLEYSTNTEDGAEWYEVNVFLSSDEYGNPVANILGRDITEAHNRQEQRELAQKAAAARDRLLSGLTKQLYSFNLNVNLNTWKYTLITGTGCDQAVSVMRMSDDYVLTINNILRAMEKESAEKVENLCGVAALQKLRGRSGFIGSVTTTSTRENGERRWQEINLFMGSNEFGEPIANVLGRDITETRREQEMRENEIRAVAAMDRILSEITKTLYSYNLTLNLRTGKYTLILGTGMENFVRIFEATDDYAKAFAEKIAFVSDEFKQPFTNLSSLDSLRNRTGETGYIGKLEYSADDGSGLEWHEINVFLGANEHGEPTANILGRDITEARKAQELRENEIRAIAAKDQILSQITKQLYSYNLTLNLNTGKYSLILGTGMKNFVRIFEATDDYDKAFEEKINYVSEEFKAPYETFSSLESLRKRVGEKGYIGRLEYSADDGSGLEWHEINIFLSSDENGQPTANILGRDITEDHERLARREKELRAASAKDQLLSGITQMLYSYNMTVNINTGDYTIITGTGLSETVKFLKEHDNYEVVLDWFHRVVLPEYLENSLKFLTLETYRGENMPTGYIGTVEVPERAENGIEWHELNVFTGYDSDGEPILNLLGRDVTESHERADTKARLEIAEAASKAKTNFLFNMSHDIRTPMNAIIGFTDLLEKHLDDKKAAEGYIDKIKYSNEFLLSLINNVLEMARIESGKETLDESVGNVHEFNDAVAAVFDNQMKEKGLTFNRTADVKHPNVFVDHTKLREILLNILSNAVKYTPAGGTITMKTVELPSPKKGYATFQTSISDTGVGMSEDFIPHIFEEFSREHNSTESRVIGTGLGMPIVKNLVTLMHGTITVESELGKGSTFTITMPHRIADDAVLNPDAEKIMAEEKVRFEGHRILLAEDNDLNAEIATTILEETGLKVDRAEDGVVCISMLEQAEAGYYDLILMDIQMPNLNGYEAAQKIRRLPDKAKADIPIIAMTANAFEEDKRKAFASGMNDHIAKPIRFPELISLLAAYLE